MDNTGAGYSGMPLVGKLGIRAGMLVAFVEAPLGYLADVLGPLPADVTVADWGAEGRLDLVHYFCRWRADLERDLLPLMGSIKRNGAIWISWPKKSAKMPGDITEDVLRAVCLPTGLVDVKVCAVDAQWSALKFVIRVELR